MVMPTFMPWAILVMISCLVACNAPPTFTGASTGQRQRSQTIEKNADVSRPEAAPPHTPSGDTTNIETPTDQQDPTPAPSISPSPRNPDILTPSATPFSEKVAPDTRAPNDPVVLTNGAQDDWIPLPVNPPTAGNPPAGGFSCHTPLTNATANAIALKCIEQQRLYYPCTASNGCPNSALKVMGTLCGGGAAVGSSVTLQYDVNKTQYDTASLLYLDRVQFMCPTFSCIMSGVEDGKKEVVFTKTLMCHESQ